MEPVVPQAEVDEAGPRHLRLCSEDPPGRDAGDDRLGDVPGLAADSTGERQRDVGGEVPEPLVPRRVDADRDVGGNLGQAQVAAGLGDRIPDELSERLLDHPTTAGVPEPALTQSLAHGRTGARC